MEVSRGGWFKGLFLIQHTNRDCFVFFGLFTFTFFYVFTFVCLVVFFSVVVFVFFFVGRVFQFSRFLGTLHLHFHYLLLVFFCFGQNWVFSRRSSGSLESICHPARFAKCSFPRG